VLDRLPYSPNAPSERLTLLEVEDRPRAVELPLFRVLLSPPDLPPVFPRSPPASRRVGLVFPRLTFVLPALTRFPALVRLLSTLMLMLVCRGAMTVLLGR